MLRVQPPRVQRGPVFGLLCVPALLSGLALTGDLGTWGWAVGLAAGVVGSALLGAALAAGPVDLPHPGLGKVGMGPADRVTLTRLVLTCGVAALVAASFVQEIHGSALVLLATVAQLLDWVDGRVARLTGTVSALGARFDMETDAFLILAMSVYVADAAGWWVLAIGLARYGFGAAGWVWPWLRGSAPPRYWCKVVAVIQGIVLTVVAADLLPAWAESGLVVVALALLAESFGREAWQLWRLRSPAPAQSAQVGAHPAICAVASGIGDG